MEDTSTAELTFGEKKQNYFRKLGREVGNVMLPLHKDKGLRSRKGSEEGDWRNVGEHSLVEVARVREFGILLNLVEGLQKNLEMAAALHDSDKLQEIKYIKTNGGLYASYLEFAKIQSEERKKSGLNERVVGILSGVGIDSFERMDKLIQKLEWTDTEIATALLNYVDCYTADDNWVVAADGGVNDLDRRTLMSAGKPTGQSLDIDVKEKGIFNGETFFEAQKRIGHVIETRLSELIEKRLGVKIEPLKLPEVIDQKIVERINSI